MEQHKFLKKFCDEQEILYMCTPFSLKAAQEIYDLVPIFKIGSGEMTDTPSLLEIANLGLPMILSTGMSDFHEIDKTYDLLKKKSIFLY